MVTQGKLARRRPGEPVGEGETNIKHGICICFRARIAGRNPAFHITTSTLTSCAWSGEAGRAMECVRTIGRVGNFRRVNNPRHFQQRRIWFVYRLCAACAVIFYVTSCAVVASQEYPALTSTFPFVVQHPYSVRRVHDPITSWSI
jgi:hypothetical protein